MICFGYDPGGNGNHGVAAYEFGDDVGFSIKTSSCATAEEALAWFDDHSRRPVAIGADTLTCWSTGFSGYRPADRWLKNQYPDKFQSVIPPNELAGAMSLNGMAVLLELRARQVSLPITETHPKVLYWHMGHYYKYVDQKDEMDSFLAKLLQCPLHTSSDHEWDAAISAIVAHRFYTKHHKWRRDLHKLPVLTGERLVHPCGLTNYMWPDDKPIKIKKIA